MAAPDIRIRLSAENKATPELTKLEQSLAKIRDAANGATPRLAALSNTMKSMAGAVAAIGAGSALAGISQAIDKFSRLEARLKRSEGSVQGAQKAMGELGRIANATGVPLDDLASSFIRFSNATAGLGADQSQVLAFTEALASGLKLDGASAMESASAMEQLGQAFSRGKAEAEELKTLMQASPSAFEALKGILGKTTEQMLAMVSSGEMTAAALLRLGEASGMLKEKAKEMPTTLGDAITNLGSSLMQAVGQSDIIRGAFDGIIAVINTLSAGIKSFGQNLDGILMTAGLFAGALTAIGAQAFFANGGLLVLTAGAMGVATALGAAATAAKAFLLALASNPVALFIVGITAGLGYVIGKYQEMEAAQAKAVDDLKARLSEAEQYVASFDARITQTKATLGTLGTALKTAFDDFGTGVEGALEDQLSLIRARYDTELALIAATKAAGQERMRAETALLQQLVRDETAAAQQAAQQRLAAAEQYAAAQTRIAQASIGDDKQRAAAIAKIETDLAGKKREIWNSLRGSYASALDQLISEHERYRDAISGIEDKIKSLRQEAADLTAEITGGVDEGASAIERYYALLEQSQQALDQARAASQAGDTEEMERYYRKAIDLAKEAAEAVKGTKDDKLGYDEAALERALAIIKEQQGQLEQIKTKYEEGDKAVQDQITSMRELVTAAGEVSNRLSEAIRDQAQIAVTLNTDLIDQELTKLQSLLDAKAIWVNVQARFADDLANLEKQIQDAAQGAEVSIPITPTLGDGTLERALEQAQKQAQPEIQAEVTVADAGQAADEITAELANDPATLPAVVEVDTSAADAAKASLQAGTSAPVDFIPNTGAVEAVKGQLSAETTSTHTVRANTSAAQAAINQLKQNTSSTHTIYCKKVGCSSDGGPVGMAKGGTPPWFPRRRGYITGPGTETSDSIPAMLSRGEFVIRAAAVRKWGLDFLRTLNAGFMPPLPRMAMGGAVTNLPSRVTAGDLPEMAINLSIQGGSPLRVMSSRETARNLTSALRNLERGR